MSFFQYDVPHNEHPLLRIAVLTPNFEIQVKRRVITNRNGNDDDDDHDNKRYFTLVSKSFANDATFPPKVRECIGFPENTGLPPLERMQPDAAIRRKSTTKMHIQDVANGKAIKEVTHVIAVKQGTTIELDMRGCNSCLEFPCICRYRLALNCYSELAQQVMTHLLHSNIPSNGSEQHQLHVVCTAVSRYYSHRRHVMGELGFSTQKSFIEISSATSPGKKSCFDIPYIGGMEDYMFARNAQSYAQRRWYDANGYSAFPQHRDRRGKYCFLPMGPLVDISIEFTGDGFEPPLNFSSNWAVGPDAAFTFNPQIQRVNKDNLGHSNREWFQELSQAWIAVCFFQKYVPEYLEQLNNFRSLLPVGWSRLGNGQGLQFNADNRAWETEARDALKREPCNRAVAESIFDAIISTARLQLTGKPAALPHILLYGVPGTGKTTAARAVAAILGLSGAGFPEGAQQRSSTNYDSVELGDIESEGYRGDEFSKVLAHFGRWSAKNGVSILLVDEVDYCTDGSRTEVLPPFFHLTQDFTPYNCMVIAPTNNPEKIINAINTRFSNRFHVPLLTLNQIHKDLFPPNRDHPCSLLRNIADNYQHYNQMCASQEAAKNLVAMSCIGICPRLLFSPKASVTIKDAHEQCKNRFSIGGTNNNELCFTVDDFIDGVIENSQMNERLRVNDEISNAEELQIYHLQNLLRKSAEVSGRVLLVRCNQSLYVDVELRDGRGTKCFKIDLRFVRQFFGVFLTLARELNSAVFQYFGEGFLRGFHKQGGSSDWSDQKQQDCFEAASCLFGHHDYDSSFLFLPLSIGQCEAGKTNFPLTFGSLISFFQPDFGTTTQHYRVVIASSIEQLRALVKSEVDQSTRRSWVCSSALKHLISVEDESETTCSICYRKFDPSANFSGCFHTFKDPNTRDLMLHVTHSKGATKVLSGCTLENAIKKMEESGGVDVVVSNLRSPANQNLKPATQYLQVNDLIRFAQQCCVSSHVFWYSDRPEFYRCGLCGSILYPKKAGEAGEFHACELKKVLGFLLCDCTYKEEGSELMTQREYAAKISMGSQGDKNDFSPSKVVVDCNGASGITPCRTSTETAEWDTKCNTTPHQAVSIADIDALIALPVKLPQLKREKLIDKGGDVEYSIRPMYMAENQFLSVSASSKGVRSNFFLAEIVSAKRNSIAPLLNILHVAKFRVKECDNNARSMLILVTPDGALHEVVGRYLLKQRYAKMKVYAFLIQCADTLQVLERSITNREAGCVFWNKLEEDNWNQLWYFCKVDSHHAQPPPPSQQQEGSPYQTQQADCRQQ